MQVVFLGDIKGIARKGDVKNVKDGYFQNYLLPRKLAAQATSAMIKQAEEMRKKMVVENERVKEKASEIAKMLEGKKVTLKSKAKGDKLYGSIGEKEIADVVEKELKVKVRKEDIVLSEHIKVAGTYEIPVKLSEGVEAKILLVVKGEVVKAEKAKAGKAKAEK
jgi:large subunit ribosomal protein L9